MTIKIDIHCDNLTLFTLVNAQVLESRQIHNT